MRITLLVTLALCCTIALHAQENDRTLSRKLSPALLKKEVALKTDAGLPAVYWIQSSDLDQLKTFLAQHKNKVQIRGEYPASRLLVIHTTRGVVDALLLPSRLVQFVDQPRKAVEELRVNGLDQSVNHINAIHHEYPSFNGSGLVVSVKENRFDTTDIDFKGRILPTPLGSQQMTQHASVMGTLMAGGGNSHFTGKGVAWGATLTSSSFQNLLPDALNDYQQYRISVQNHSYGTGIENYYGADAAAYDASVNIIPTLLHVFSAGNSGSQTSSDGPYSGVPLFANLTGSFKMAKNIITVGAVDSFAQVAVASSKGPAYDGRIKPELVAFGQDGSSGAAAIVSGISLVLQQAYQVQHAGVLPPAALVKAMLLNSADDVGAPGPDYRNGFGNVNALQALRTMEENRYQLNIVAQGETRTFAITVPEGIRQLKITLCWTDPAANGNAPKALINNLDMELIHDPTSQVWLPWVLNGFAHTDSLQKPAIRKRDTLNNVEQITLNNPSAGTYTIRVTGAVIPGGAQDFAYAYQLDTLNTFHWQFPVRTDNLEGKTNNLLRWHSGFPAATGQLEYSSDAGSSWKTISTSVDLKKGNLYWSTPDTFTTALLRMTIGGQPFLSDTFTISSRLLPKVGFNCADSFMVYWNKPHGVNQFRVYELAGNYLTPVTTTNDTFIILRKPTHPALHYTVAPALPLEREGVKSFTFNYTLQGVDCYIKTFLVDLFPPNSAIISLELGTLYQVKNIAIEKGGNGAFTTLQQLTISNNLQFDHTDHPLTKGFHTYRAKIELTNGAVIYSEPATVYSFGDQPYIVFPNPARLSGSLQVMATGNDLEGLQLLLYTATGQKVWQQSMIGNIASIPLQGFSKGVHFLVIQQRGKRVFSTGVVMY